MFLGLAGKLAVGLPAFSIQVPWSHQWIPKQKEAFVLVFPCKENYMPLGYPTSPRSLCESAFSVILWNMHIFWSKLNYVLRHSSVVEKPALVKPMCQHQLHCLVAGWFSDVSTSFLPGPLRRYAESAFVSSQLKALGLSRNCLETPRPANVNNTWDTRDPAWTQS